MSEDHLPLRRVVTSDGHTFECPKALEEHCTTLANLSADVSLGSNKGDACVGTTRETLQILAEHAESRKNARTEKMPPDEFDTYEKTHLLALTREQLIEIAIAADHLADASMFDDTLPRILVNHYFKSMSPSAICEFLGVEQDEELIEQRKRICMQNLWSP